MKKIISFLFILSGLLYGNKSNAQGGGPPMITDDPGVVDLHKWELNTSLNVSVTKTTQIAFPYIDLNYGVARNLQLKAETGYIFNFYKKQTTSNFDDISVGVKYNFLHEDKSFLSAGIYPQATVSGDNKGFLFPLLLEKTFGKFLIGEDIGVSFGENNYMSFQNGILLGYQLNNRLQIMGEYFMERTLSPDKGTYAYMNYGFRYHLNNSTTFIGSFGRQIMTPAFDQQEYFISFLGIQSSF